MSTYVIQRCVTHHTLLHGAPKDSVLLAKSSKTKKKSDKADNQPTCKYCKYKDPMEADCHCKQWEKGTGNKGQNKTNNGNTANIVLTSDKDVLNENASAVLASSLTEFPGNHIDSDQDGSLHVYLGADNTFLSHSSAETTFLAKSSKDETLLILAAPDTLALIASGSRINLLSLLINQS